MVNYEKNPITNNKIKVIDVTKEKERETNGQWIIN